MTIVAETEEEAHLFLRKRCKYDAVSEEKILIIKSEDKSDVNFLP